MVMTEIPDVIDCIRDRLHRKVMEKITGSGNLKIMEMTFRRNICINDLSFVFQSLHCIVISLSIRFLIEYTLYF